MRSRPLTRFGLPLAPPERAVLVQWQMPEQLSRAGPNSREYVLRYPSLKATARSKSRGSGRQHRSRREPAASARSPGLGLPALPSMTKRQPSMRRACFSMSCPRTHTTVLEKASSALCLKYGSRNEMGMKPIPPSAG